MNSQRAANIGNEDNENEQMDQVIEAWMHQMLDDTVNESQFAPSKDKE